MKRGSHRLAWMTLIVAGLAQVAVTPVSGQAPRRWAVGAALGVASVGMTRGAGRATAGHARIGIARYLSPRLSAVLSMDAYTMAEGQAIPSCLPNAGSACGSRTTQPGLLLGTSLGLSSQLTDGISLMGSVGGFTGPDIQGAQARSTAALSAGAEFELPWRSRFTPIIGVRYVYFTTPLAGVRSLIGPGAGVGF
jgi:hypothetical protein